MKIHTIISAFGGLFITVPLWLYLLFKILQSIHASELMWFLFWVYLAASIFIGFVSGVVKGIEEDNV